MYKQYWLDALYLFIIIVFPVFPAYLIYKTLPSETTAAGPFKGLQINLKGAFAGYFLLVLLAAGVILARRPSATGYQIWTVTGRTTIPGLPGDAHASYSLKPPDVMYLSEGIFSIAVPVNFSEGDTYRFPTLVVEYPSRETVNIPLTPNAPLFGTHNYRLAHNNVKREIQINDLVALTLAAPYPVNAAPLTAGRPIADTQPDGGSK